MSEDMPLTKRDHVLLIGDGLVFTSATSAVGIGLPLGLWAVAGSPGSSMFWGLLNSVSMFAGGIAGVALTWWLHGRRFTGEALLGGLLGVPVGGLLIPVFMLSAFLIGYPMRLVSTSEFAGPIAMLAVVGVAFFALLAWLLADAIRDMAPARRRDLRLDVGRVVAAIVLLVYSGVVIAMSLRQPGSEMGEAIIFAVVGGVVGAAVIAGADAVTAYAHRQTRSNPPVAAGG